MMRLSALSRRGEVDRMESEFARIDIPIAGHIAAPGLLDGNDVMLAGDTAFVGVGARGNELGRRGFAEARAQSWVPRRRGASSRPACRRCARSPLPLRRIRSCSAPDKVDARAFAGFQDDRSRRGRGTGRRRAVLGRASRDRGHSLSHGALDHAARRHRRRSDRSVRLHQGRHHAVDVALVLRRD